MIAVICSSCCGLRPGVYEYSKNGETIYDQGIYINLFIKKDGTFVGDFPFNVTTFYSTGDYRIKKDTLFLISKPADFIDSKGYNLADYVFEQPDSLIPAGYLNLSFFNGNAYNISAGKTEELNEYLAGFRFTYLDQEMHNMDIVPISRSYIMEQKIDTMQFLLPLDIRKKGFLTIAREPSLMQSRTTLNLYKINSRNLKIDYCLLIYPSLGEYMDRTGDKFLIRQGKLLTLDVRTWLAEERLPVGLPLKRTSVKNNPIRYFGE
jgi:hypothetical protein